MLMYSKTFVYLTLVLATFMTNLETVYASPKTEMHNFIARYKLIGRIDEVNQIRRTVIMGGKEYNLAAGVNILGMGSKNKYNVKVLKPGMQIGYKLMFNSSNTISELWVMPE